MHSSFAVFVAVAFFFAFSFATTGPKSCDCPVVYEPVCGKDGKKYPTPCFAACFGATPTTPLVQGKCASAGVPNLRTQTKSLPPTPASKLASNTPASHLAPEGSHRLRIANVPAAVLPAPVKKMTSPPGEESQTEITEEEANVTPDEMNDGFKSSQEQRHDWGQAMNSDSKQDPQVRYTVGRNSKQPTGPMDDGGDDIGELELLSLSNDDEGFFL